MIIQAGCTRNTQATYNIEQPTKTRSPTSGMTGSTVTPTSKISPSQTPTNIVIPTEEVNISTNYNLVIDLDYYQHILRVDEKVNYLNTGQSPLNEILFVIQPNLVPGTVQINSIQWINQGAISTYVLDHDYLTIPLPVPLLPEKTIGVDIIYVLNIPEIPGCSGYTPRQLNLCDFYFRIPPFEDGKGWLVHPKGKVGEYEVYDLADFDIEIHGLDQAEKLVLAPASTTTTNAGVYQLSAKRVRNFSLSISDGYEISSRQLGNIQVYSYYFPDDAIAGKAALQATIQGVELFQDKFLPYPHMQLSIVEADFPDGMETDGLFFLGKEYYQTYDQTPQTYLISLTVHETAHQWWFASVGNDQATEPWLDEALSTYSELFFYQQYYPKDVDWWWNYRVLRFHPTGWVNSTIYDFDSFRPYVNAVYLRGALAIDQIRHLLGDEQFMHFLRQYNLDYSGKISHTSDFFNLLTQFSNGKSLKFLSSYFK